MKMKKLFLKTNLLIGGMVLALVLSGCTITTVSLRYYDKTKPVEEYCRVYFQRNWQILMFNDDNVANAFSMANTVVIPGGKQAFGLRYADVTYNSTVTITNISDIIILEYDFTPNRFYYVYPTIEDNIVKVNILDTTDLTAAELKAKGFQAETIEKIIARKADSEETLRKAKK
jgi:hypothetical protein